MLIRLLEIAAGYPRLLRVLAALMVAAMLLFLVDNFFVYWTEWPGIGAFLTHQGLLAPARNFKALEGFALIAGWIQFLLFAATLLLVVWWVIRTPGRDMDDDGRLFDALASYFTRMAFWAVLLVGLADSVISFLRVEGFLHYIVGDHLTTQLGRSIFRGTWVHYPLVGIAAVIALFSRSIGFIWLSLMIVAAEFTIVISRFVFSYEQAFQGDVVRFWYAGLFLFASAYTLMHDGHVRVDVLYTNFSERGQAVTNALGSLLLGLPLCWTIMILGTGSRGSIIISPLLSYEISQSGFGMYTKYLMAAYLMVFALTMGIQFVSFFLSNMARFTVPRDEPDGHLAEPGDAPHRVEA